MNSEILNVDNVVVFALSTGQEIIAKITGVDEYTVTLSKTLGLGYNFQEGTNKLNFGFVPHGPLVRDEKVYSRAHIVYVAIPKDDLFSAYQQATGAVLTPPKGVIVA